LIFLCLQKRSREKSLIKICAKVCWKVKSFRKNYHPPQRRRSKKLYRIIEFSQTRMDVPAKVTALEYDPNRTGFIALIEYTDKSKAIYYRSPGIKSWRFSGIFRKRSVKHLGNRMKLKILVGTSVYNIELEPGKGGILVRSAGNAAQVLAQEHGFTNLKMPSSEVRKVKDECFATIGMVSNPENRFYRVGKAGKSRLKGRRPHVRGSAMNPVDHPHGGGEGRQPIGLKASKNPMGIASIRSEDQIQEKVDE
jgi:large subunit ribosomal protein L2